MMRLDRLRFFDPQITLKIKKPAEFDRRAKVIKVKTY